MGKQPEEGDVSFVPFSIPKASEEICNQITRMIRDGRIKPGERLPSERHLMEMFQRSRTSVREALRMLEQKGLTRTMPGKRGSVVTEISELSLREPLETMLSLNQISDEELLEMRRLLDVFTCSLAARRRTTIDLDAIKEQLEKAKAPKVSIPEFAALDGSFHRALAAASHNRLAALMDQVYSQLVLVRLEDMFSHKSAEGKKAMIQNILSSHEKILMAVEAGDESAAKKAMEDHLLLFSKDL